MSTIQTAPFTHSGPIAGLSDPAEAWQFQLDGLAGPGLPASAVAGGLQGAAGAVPDPRHHGSPGPDHRPDAGRGRRSGHPHAGPVRPRRRDAIPGAQFVLLPDEAHQPFQEVADDFNALVDGFWRRVDAGG